MNIGVVCKESCYMLHVKSLIILKTNPGILKGGGGITMWIRLHVTREL